MRAMISADRVAGLFFVVLGAVILTEGWRLRALRTRGVVGDDTFPFILGLAMVLLGGLLFLTSRPQNKTVCWPKGRASRSMVETALTLVGYYVAMPYLGYGPSTILAAVLLFFTVARYRWYICLAGGAAVAAVFYYVFVVWLKMPFTIGILGY
jgi:hypothetical protein